MQRHTGVLLVDAHEVVRQGLRRILESQEDMRVVADFSNAEEAFAQIADLRPDVVFMNADMPGTTVTRGHPETRALWDSEKTLIAKLPRQFYKSLHRACLRGDIRKPLAEMSDGEFLGLRGISAKGLAEIRALVPGHKHPGS